MCTSRAADRVQEFSPTGAYLSQFGSPGSGNGQFAGPSAIAIDSSGNVWVLDTFNYRIQEFSTERGIPRASSAPQGTGNGQLGWAFGLAFSGGNLYVSELGNSRVQEFSTAGAYLGQFGTTWFGQRPVPRAVGHRLRPEHAATSTSQTPPTAASRSSAPQGAFVTTFGSSGSGSGQLSDAQGGGGQPLRQASSSPTRATTGSRNGRRRKAKNRPSTRRASRRRTSKEASRNRTPWRATRAGTSSWATRATTGCSSSTPNANTSGSGAQKAQGKDSSRGIAGIATNAAGDVYVSSSSTACRSSPRPGPSSGSSARPARATASSPARAAIAIDSSGNVWVLDTFQATASQEFSAERRDTSRKFGSEGTGNGQLGWAFGLAFSGGNLYVSELGNSEGAGVLDRGRLPRAVRLSEARATASSTQPWGIASDPSSGNLYVSDTGQQPRRGVQLGRQLHQRRSATRAQGQHSCRTPEGVAVGSSGKRLHRRHGQQPCRGMGAVRTAGLSEPRAGSGGVRLCREWRATLFRQWTGGC